MAVTPTNRRRRRLLAAALAGTPLVVPAWALVTSQRTYDGNRVVGGTVAAPVVLDAPAPPPGPAAQPIVVTLPVANGPAPTPAAAPEPAPTPAPERELVATPLPVPVAPVLATIVPPSTVDLLPPIDWAALEQLAAALTTPPAAVVTDAVAPIDSTPVDPTPLAEELLP